MSFRTVLRIEYGLRAGLNLLAFLLVLRGLTPPGLNGHLLFEGTLEGILAALLLILLALNGARDIGIGFVDRVPDDEDGDEVV
jgi:hypothetical protein